VIFHVNKEEKNFDLIVYGFFEKDFDEKNILCKEIETLRKTKLFEAQKKSSFFLFHENTPYLLVGLGKKSEVNPEDFRIAGGIIASHIQEKKIKSITLNFPLESKSYSEDLFISALTEGIFLGNYSFTKLKKEQDKNHLEKINLISSHSSAKKLMKESWIVSESVNFAKDLVNLPGNLLTPTELAKKAEKIAKENKLSCKILDEQEMKKENMNALLSVSKGSDEEAKFIILEHKPEEFDETIVFVGKGLTFDAGGISLKPAANMHEMKSDMAGSAAVLGTLQAVAQLELKIHVVGLIPSSENLINGQANKPGDVIKSRNGKTIEILNTDAEGRLLLADALSYAEKYDPDAVIDIATLTGAVIIGLGHIATGLMGNNEALISELEQAGEETNEKVWELPLFDEYKEQLKSNVADLANIGGRPAGSVTAGAFLSEFSEKYFWAHLDIAGTSWTDGKKQYLQKGASGVGVRLFIQFLKNRLL
jgi:leucyl aminopeptidase